MSFERKLQAAREKKVFADSEKELEKQEEEQEEIRRIKEIKETPVGREAMEIVRNSEFLQAIKMYWEQYARKSRGYEKYFEKALNYEEILDNDASELELRFSYQVDTERHYDDDSYYELINEFSINIYTKAGYFKLIHTRHAHYARQQDDYRDFGKEHINGERIMKSESFDNLDQFLDYMVGRLV